MIFATLLALFAACSPEPKGPTLTLPPLPWPSDALEPVISQQTIELHHGKHHAGYVAKANQLIDDSRFKGKSVEEILSATREKKKYKDLFNNTAQAWNHAFFWECLTPEGTARPTGALAQAINTEFGGWKAFRDEFIEASLSHFGSGWVWLVRDKETLRILTTANADTPVARGLTPLFTIDLWEHAYYLDVQNRRKAYVEGVFDGLAHWKAVEKRYGTGEL
ncbi:superoxide dismutase [Desulfoluna spongiiphila]|uniref:superoxide dismutase n=1 Tax=Desulfoluna spongiiphila TaxID=419481 RepID=UPI001C31825F|nr:superoxide dismutase [Desulfoluna spongiiphila]